MSQKKYAYFIGTFIEGSTLSSSDIQRNIKKYKNIDIEKFSAQGFRFLAETDGVETKVSDIYEDDIIMYESLSDLVKDRILGDVPDDIYTDSSDDELDEESNSDEQDNEESDEQEESIDRVEQHDIEPDADYIVLRFNYDTKKLSVVKETDMLNTIRLCFEEELTNLRDEKIGRMNPPSNIDETIDHVIHMLDDVMNGTDVGMINIGLSEELNSTLCIFNENSKFMSDENSKTIPAEYLADKTPCGNIYTCGLENFKAYLKGNLTLRSTLVLQYSNVPEPGANTMMFRMMSIFCAGDRAVAISVPAKVAASSFGSTNIDMVFGEFGSDVVYKLNSGYILRDAEGEPELAATEEIRVVDEAETVVKPEAEPTNE